MGRCDCYRLSCVFCNPTCETTRPMKIIETESGLRRSLRQYEDEPALTLNERIQDVFDKYADAFDHIYDNRTRGDFTAKGFLAEFLMDIDKTRAEHAD